MSDVERNGAEVTAEAMAIVLGGDWAVEPLAGDFVVASDDHPLVCATVSDRAGTITTHSAVKRGDIGSLRPWHASSDTRRFKRMVSALRYMRSVTA